MTTSCIPRAKGLSNPKRRSRTKRHARGRHRRRRVLKPLDAPCVAPAHVDVIVSSLASYFVSLHFFTFIPPSTCVPLASPCASPNPYVSVCHSGHHLTPLRMSLCHAPLRPCLLASPTGPHPSSSPDSVPDLLLHPYVSTSLRHTLLYMFIPTVGPCFCSGNPDRSPHRGGTTPPRVFVSSARPCCGL